MPAHHGNRAHGISPYAGRSTRRYKTTRAQFRDDCSRYENPDGSIGAPCWLCGNPIDYTLAHPHPECFNLDHAIVIEDRPDLAEDPANYRPSHKHCNEERGNGDPHIVLGQPSEDW